MRVLATGCAHTRIAERDMPCAQCTWRKCPYAFYFMRAGYTSALWFLLLSSTLAMNSTTRSNHTKSLEVSVGGVLDGNVHDQNPPVEVLAQVRLDCRYDVHNTKALQNSGSVGSKEI